MKVSIKKASPGDIAHFKCGGKAEIIAVEPSQRFYGRCHFIKFIKPYWGYNILDNGHFVVGDDDGKLEGLKDCPFSIVRIEKRKQK